ncbi:MAG TPA: hypothetical protein VGM90_41190 [Kofleriaceae bacterium]
MVNHAPALLGEDLPLQLEAGFAAGFPAALPTGLSRGVGVGASLGWCPFRIGVRAAWMTATESSESWEVTNSDLHLRATAGVEQVAGRGSFGLRLAAGGTLVHESRMRQQGARAGLMGDELETSTWAMLPAADLEATVDLAVYDAWHFVISGGPSIALLDQQPHWSWISQIGIGWRR